MQEQRNSFESLPESLQFDCGTNSNSSDMDQTSYQNNLLLDPVETPTLADFLLSTNEENMDYMAVIPEGPDDLGIWNSRDPNHFVVNHENQNETKIGDGWNTALSISSGGSPRMEERRCARTNLSFESFGLNLNLNDTPVIEGQSFTHNLNSTDMSQSAVHNLSAGSHANNVEVSLCPFIPEFLESEHVPNSNFNGSSSSGVGHVPEDDVRERNSGRHLASKRKSMEGFIGESSTSHISADLNTPSSSIYLPSSLEENQSPSFSHFHRVSPEWYPPSILSRNADTSQRNLRARLNLSRQHDVSSSQSLLVESNNRISSNRSPGEPSSLNSFIHSAEQSQPHILPVSVLPHHIHHPPSSSRIGNSSIPAFLQRRIRVVAAHEETNIRSLPTTTFTDHPTFPASTSVNHLVQDPANWNPSNSNLNMLGNRVGSSSGIIPLPVSMREPNEMVPVQQPRSLAVAVRSSLFPSVGSELAHQSTTLPSRSSVRSASTQEPGQSSRAIWQGHSQPYPRTAVPSDRQHGLSALPLSARSRDRRSRMISEIRNALDLMRRGANLRFEDIFFFDQSGFYGRHNFLDRHRDLRLDVDNMSYEELLALEERIGYVSTGLCEQVILKCLKRQIYSTCKLKVVDAEQEPCCICQEDYSEEEDIGILDCRHEFHTDCIKQWLTIKNLCPICKTTALVVEGCSTMSDETG